jgi:Chaperone of endosialidase
MGIFDIFSDSDAQAAAAAQTAAIQQGLGQLNSYYGQGANTLNQNYGNALSTLQNQQGANNAGQTQLANLLGLNGAAGDASAQNTLQNLPGYQFALNQGSQNVLRNQAATGQLNSGATLNALQQQGQGLASQNYKNYLSQLQPYLQASNTGAANIAGTQTGLGNQLSTLYQGQGNAALSGNTAIGNAQAQADYANLAQSGAIFGGLTGLAGGLLKLSDERAKDDIEPVGELFDGQTVYRYRYKGDRHHEIGLIAQEVEDRDPGAVAPIGKFKGVDYRRATNWAAELGRMAA